MAYTQSVLQTELSKQQEASAGWPWHLMTLSLVVLLTVGAVYVGMKFGFEGAYLQSSLKTASNTSAQISKSVSPDEQKQIFNFYSQLSNIDTLLKKQGRGSIYLDAIEKNTLKAIVYSNLDARIDENGATLKMDGKTSSYSLVAQQMELYKKMANVKDVRLFTARVAAQASDGIVFTIQVVITR